MNKHVQWIVYKGKKILFIDCVGLKADEIVNVLEASKQEVQKLPDGSHYLSLTDNTNAVMSPEVSAKGREMVAIVKEKGFSVIAAVVNATQFQSSVAKMVAPGMYFSNSLEEAKEWLVAQKE
jgi:hypothetical protein